ncbi:hypothetical protein [Burkholderia ubonensis]|uniref:Uncharacterized protein n=1 Tax=Burkholderia ubonensis subsp. mesacidophila TaxID=265293 RepID=A0A2A4FPS6_9BURK|nr:hypothetical protein [Burkholderia ubonensis]PCE34426.1 hypothetical protein BZL54_00135 [Burkholderia ubonensis subsp. mesacidophila]
MANLATQILDLTRVVTDADDAQPGKPVQISVLPGFSSSLPTTTTLNGVTLSGALVGALPSSLTGTITGVLNTLVDPVTLKVTYQVKKDGMPVATTDFTATPPIAVASVPSDPLNVAFLLKPPVGEDTSATEPSHYQIDVNLTVTVEGVSESKTITVPIDMPAIQIPALLLLGKHANFAAYDGDNPGSLFVMVRASSPLRELGEVVAALNRLMGLLKTVKSVLDVGSVFLDTLGYAATLIGTIPTIYFSVGNTPNLDGEGLSFEDDASALLLIGVKDTKVTLYSDGGFEKGGIDEEYSVFTVDEIAISGIPTGLGLIKIDTFVGLDWQTDKGDHMNDDTSSVRWGGI